MLQLQNGQPHNGQSLPHNHPHNAQPSAHNAHSGHASMVSSLHAMFGSNNKSKPPNPNHRGQLPPPAKEQLEYKHFFWSAHISPAHISPHHSAQLPIQPPSEPSPVQTPPAQITLQAESSKELPPPAYSPAKALTAYSLTETPISHNDYALYASPAGGYKRYIGLYGYSSEL